MPTNPELRRLRSTYGYRQAGAAQRAKRLPCWICGREIDYSAVPRTRWSYSTDHVIALEHGGHLTAADNLKSAHYGCNSGRGNRGQPKRGGRYVAPKPSAGCNSREW